MQSETSSLIPARATSLVVASDNNQETALPREWLEQHEQHATEESVEVIRVSSEDAEALDNTAGVNNNGDATTGARDDQSEEGPVAQLARRLRCLFSTVTWPIIPLGTILSLALLWVLYAAFVLDLRRSCSRPLHWYAAISLVFVTYAPYHPQVRNYLFDYSPERDGPPRPIAVRLYDQLFHTLCILYVYSGVTLLETCRESTEKENTTVVFDKDGGPTSSDGVTNTCAATCPNLYQALAIYVTTLELFTFSLILPLLFLPCVYLWIIRRASAEQDAFAQFQDRLEEEEALLNNGGLTAQEIIDSLEKVKLVDAAENDVVLLPLSSTNDDALDNTREGNVTRECCICMSEFEVTHPGDEETGACEPENIMVQTKCGHVFHAACLAGWLGGRWEPNEASTENSADSPRRRARRTACPLCREDLKPPRESPNR